MRTQASTSRRSLFLGAFALFVSSATGSADPPVTGLPIPELADIDQAVIDAMNAQDIAGWTVGVMKNGKIIYQHGFGWRNEGQTVAMPENATMRLASVSKAIVRQCINELITDGSLDGDRPVFDIGQEGGQILIITPWGGVQDERVGDITSRHLRDLRVDWETDYAWDSIEIYEAMGFDPEIDPPPPSIEDMVRYALGHETGEEPGLSSDELPEDFEYPYSNFA